MVYETNKLIVDTITLPIDTMNRLQTVRETASSHSADRITTSVNLHVYL